MKYTSKEKKSTKFIFKQILNTVFGVFLKIDTRSHGLKKQNAIDMQIQSTKRLKEKVFRRQSKRKLMRILNSGHIRFLIMRVLNK